MKLLTAILLLCLGCGDENGKLVTNSKTGGIGIVWDANQHTYFVRPVIVENGKLEYKYRHEGGTVLVLWNHHDITEGIPVDAELPEEPFLPQTPETDAETH